MKTLKYLIGGLMLMSLCVFNSCKDEPIDENPSGEAFIYNLRIMNGGITGNIRYDGVLNEDSKTVIFDIPAESDIENVQFGGRISLGAKFDKETYDFSQNLTQKIGIINVDNLDEYTVTLNLDEPKTTPFIERLIVTTNNGVDIEAFVDVNEKAIFLKASEESEVTVKSLVTRPIRTIKTFTAIADNKLSKANPGKLKLDFMGLTDEYRISFGSKLAIYDYSMNPLDGPTAFPDFIAENTRSADFDGNYALIVSREGGNKVKLLKTEDIIARNTANPILLDLAGVAGGTYTISAGRLAQGHIYICNLTTGVANTDAGKLKVYHWASPTASPEMIIDFNGVTPAITGRFGDNISVNLDASGNGYIYLVEHATGAKILRFKVANFKTVTEPTVLIPAFAASYYASFNKVADSEDEYLYCSTKSVIGLVDKDGKAIYTMDAASTPKGATDARIIYFAKHRYLIMTTGRALGQGAEIGPKFVMYDISEGETISEALTLFEAAHTLPYLSFSLDGPGVSAMAANSGWGIRNGNLYLFSAATKAGFALFELPE